MKKALSFLLILTLLSSSIPVNVVALESSIISSEVNTVSTSSGTTDVPDINVFENLNSDPTGLIDLTQDQNAQTSAFFNLPVKVQLLRKRNFRADEKITIIVENASVDNVKIQLFDVDGIEVPVEMEQVSSQDPAVLRLIPPKQFKAGRYRLSITDPTGQITNQNFTWGVLAINTNKSIYLPSETANIAIAVLDETGLMVCDADVTLQIKNSQLGIDDVLSTQNGKIIVNPDCSIKDYTPKPDYEATYLVGGVGVYELTLTSQTKNGTYSINDAFDVRDNSPFDVERVNATRIYPPITYSSIFNITANEDFTGTITETVPDSFAILATEGGIFADNISSESAQTSSEDLIKGEIPSLFLPYEGEFAISQKFGSEIRDPLAAKKYKDFGLAGHDGIDFDLPEGTPVLAADDGEVVRTDPNGDYGATVIIQHSWGKSYYGHFSEITAQVGKKILKGHPIGLSGSTGLSSGPHLHFGIKPNKNDFNNGYYGKINPASYLGLETVQITDENIVFSSSQTQSYAVKVLTWNVSLKKGDKIKLGYGYKVPNISPQFYLLGPLQFTDLNGEVFFQESRQWQLAIDADGSGTNVVDVTTGTTSTTGNTYTFTFDPTETMDSGGITIAVPSGWSAPQETAGTAGYTTATGNTNGTVARVLNNADSITGWAENDTDACNTANLATDTGTKQEGTASIKCDNSGSTLTDATDSFSFDFTAENWSSYSQLGVWVRTSANFASGDAVIGYDDATNCGNNNNANLIESFNFTTTANTWEYKKFTLTAARTSVVGFCINAGTASGLDSRSIWIDDVLIGPGVPTFSGTGPWSINVRFLDLAATDTVTIVYGDGGGASGVTNSSTEGVHTFTTQSRISDAGTLTNIGTSPTVTLTAPAGPTLEQTMRHGKWFSSGVEQPFTF